MAATAAITRKKNLYESLSPRQRSIYVLSARFGWQAKDIANKLNLSPATVHAQLGWIYIKCGVDNHASLVAHYYLRRLLRARRTARRALPERDLFVPGLSYAIS